MSFVRPVSNELANLTDLNISRARLATDATICLGLLSLKSYLDGCSTITTGFACLFTLGSAYVAIQQNGGLSKTMTEISPKVIATAKDIYTAGFSFAKNNFVKFKEMVMPTAVEEQTKQNELRQRTPVPGKKHNS